MSQQPPHTPPRVTDQELMLWVDGELEGRRAAEVAAHVHGDRRARAIVTALRLGSDLIESDALRHARSSGADDIADAVMENIEAVASLRISGRPKRAHPWRLPAITAAGLAFAAAAVWAVFFRGAAPGLPVAEIASSLPALPGLVASATAGGDTQTASIEVVDFGARPGTIFYVPSEGESAMAVVWLTDDDSSPSNGDPQ
jgi:anti-sigma factor RsiW